MPLGCRETGLLKAQVTHATSGPGLPSQEGWADADRGLPPPGFWGLTQQPFTPPCRKSVVFLDGHLHRVTRKCRTHGDVSPGVL